MHSVKYTDHKGNVTTLTFPCKSDAIESVLRAAKRELRKSGLTTITINELDNEHMSVLFADAASYIDAVTL